MSRRYEVELIVDTRATYTVLPNSLLEKLGVKPFRTIISRWP